MLPALDKNKKQYLYLLIFQVKKFKKKFLFNNLNESLKTFKPDIVYISKTNSLHFKFAKIILKKGYNTIVDKPITLDLQKQKN